MITCKNCNNTYEGNFCPNCGQDAKTPDINFHYLVHEIQHGIFHVDKGLVYTTKQLFKRPGFAVKEYIDGKRVKHFKPLAYIFIICTIYGLLAFVLKDNTLQNETRFFAKPSKSNDTTKAINGISFEINSFGSNELDEKVNSKLETFAEIFHWFDVHYAYNALFSLPIVAFASWLVFRRRKLSYIKHVVFESYFTGQRTIIYIFILLLMKLLGDYFPVDKMFAFLLVAFILTIINYKQLFGLSTFKSLLLSLFTGLIYSVLFGITICIVFLLSLVF